MPMFVTGSKGSAQDALGIPLQLREWTEYEGEVAAVGQRLDSGHEAEVVAVILSTRDRHADNPNRRSLAEWRDGYRALNREFRLEIGGIVLFKNCRQLGHSVYVSTWPNVLASNSEEAPKVCKADHAVMRVVMPAGATSSRSDAGPLARRVGNRTADSRPGRGASERGPWGDVVVFYPEASVACADESAAADEAFRLANLRELREPMFLLRGINGSGEVVAASKVALGRKRDVVNGQDVYVLPSADDLANSVHTYAVAIRSLSRSVMTFNLLPAGRWLLSPRTFFAPKRTEGTVNVSRAFRQQEENREVYVAKEVLFKLSEESRDNAQYVNAIYPVDPFGPGRNLDLLGGLGYSRDAILTAVRPDSRPETGPAQPAPRAESAPGRTGPSGVRSLGGHKHLELAPQPVARESAPRPDGAGRRGGMTDDPFAGIPSVRARPRR
jgi:hypothetical protein